MIATDVKRAARKHGGKDCGAEALHGLGLSLTEYDKYLETPSRYTALAPRRFKEFFRD
jgi:hypothetical protein